MNDFTKEELEMLSHGILRTITEDTQARYAPLYNKIESMIENYCDHEPSDPLMGLVKECKNCKKCIDHRRWEFGQDWRK